ncbi:MAG: hypothetical protein ACRDZY_15575 [Acidimicrobiales bacterium]
MEPRFDHRRANPEAARAMTGFQSWVEESGVEPALVRLIEVRASQINGCGY